MAEGGHDGFSVERVPIPAVVGDIGWDDFAEAIRVRNAVEAAATGTDALGIPPEQLIGGWNDPYEPKTLFIGRVEGRVVARAVYLAPIEDGSISTWMGVEVLPEFRRRGIGTALLDALEAQAAADGRTVLQGGAYHSAADGPRLAPPTGFGSVPADNPEVRFAVAHGYALEQIMRVSSFTLDGSDESLAALRADAQEAAGPDYRFVQWLDPTPDDRLDALALLMARMSTDAPSAGLDVDEAAWDADRVRSWEATANGMGERVLWGVVEHVPSGALVAYNELGTSGPGRVRQGDTLVHGDHRGHRLGMLVKTGNLQALRAFRPEATWVHTDNAEENRPMLDVNEKIGFVPIAYQGAWRKDVSG